MEIQIDHLIIYSNSNSSALNLRKLHIEEKKDIYKRDRITTTTNLLG